MKITKAWLRGFLVDLIGGFLLGVGLITFAKNASFAPGGIQGLALIVHHFTKLPIGLLQLLLNIPLIFMSYKVLGKQFILRTAQSLVVMSVMTDYVAPLLPEYNGNPLLASLFAAVLIGVGLAFIYQVGSSTGGTDLIIFSLRKFRPELSVGQVTNIINAVVIFLGGFVFKNIDAVLYGFIYSITLSTVVDKIMYGFVSGKMAFIISDDGERLARVIGEQVKRGSTLIPARGGFTKRPRELIMVVCNRRQLQLLREVVQKEDPNALLIVSEFNEVYGRGFIPLVTEAKPNALKHLEGREGDERDATAGL